jgi:hypothetical protein
MVFRQNQLSLDTSVAFSLSALSTEEVTIDLNFTLKWIISNKPQPSITGIFMSKNNKTGSSLGRFSKKQGSRIKSFGSHGTCF